MIVKRESETLQALQPDNGEPENLSACWRSLLGDAADDLIHQAYADAATGVHIPDPARPNSQLWERKKEKFCRERTGIKTT